MLSCNTVLQDGFVQPNDAPLEYETIDEFTKSMLKAKAEVEKGGPPGVRTRWQTRLQKVDCTSSSTNARDNQKPGCSRMLTGKRKDNNQAPTRPDSSSDE